MATSPPHFIWIVADDLGTFDVPFTNSGSEVRTPTLSRLAANGLVLDSYYVQPLCTPSRAAFMTGRHPVSLGLQHGVILDAVPDAVPINETLLPQLLRAAGYKSYFFGKWHLGFHQPRFTPERRGFDAALGYYTGNAEYWNHTSPCWSCGNFTAVDLHYSNASHFIGLLGASDYYSTELFAAAAVATIHRHAASSSPLFLYIAFEAVHGASSCYVAGKPPDCNKPDDDELQVPIKYEQQQSHIVHKPRRQYAGMVGALDEAVANVTSALEATKLMSNSLLLFTTDNGAPFKHLGGAAMSNFPLRGGKAELWEGGVKGACFLHGGALPSAATGQRSDTLIHASDWLPTFLHLAGVTVPSAIAAKLYGVDMSRVLQSPHAVGRYELRNELLLNSDPRTHRAALRSGDLKLLRDEPPSAWGPDPRGEPNAKNLVAEGPASEFSSWQVRPGSTVKHRYMLFDVVADPREVNDLSAHPRHAADLARLIARLEETEQRLSVALRGLQPDPHARPMPIPGHTVCTPSPIGPILCDAPIGLWQPWHADGVDGAINGFYDLQPGVTTGSICLLIACAIYLVTKWRRRNGLSAAAELTSAAFDELRMKQRRASGMEPAASGDLDDEDPPSPLRQRAVLPSSSSDATARLFAGFLAAVGALLLVLVLLSAAPEPGAPAAWPAEVTVEMLFDHPSTLWDGWIPPPAASISVAAPSPPAASPAPPPPAIRNNILLILTDDQDQILGGGFSPDDPIDSPTPMPRTRELIGRRGLTARHFFAHSPICCPSRAQILTGRYLHNLRVHPSQPLADPREDCMHVDGNRVNNKSFALALQSSGYATALFGKYLNNWPMRQYVPLGFDAFLGNGGGHYLGAPFAAKGMGWYGINNGMWTARHDEYTTSIVGNATAAWVRRMVTEEQDKPFFAMMAPKAPHEPFVPASWYADTWEASWPSHEPRPPAWNATAETRGPRHGNLRTQRPMSPAASSVVTGVFRNRWRTLMSVDDAVDAVLAACGDTLERTFVIFTSDHGFSLGEFGMLMDKRHVYDFDTRVPFLVRGPGILPRSVLEQPATHVDLAPTILDMAGLRAEDHHTSVGAALAAMDGRSLLPLLIGDMSDHNLGSGLKARLAALGGNAVAYAATWRHAVLIEHLFHTANIKCVESCTFEEGLVSQRGNYPQTDVWCADVRALTTCWGTSGADPEWQRPMCEGDCYPTEDEANNFAALRHVGTSPLGEGGSLYAEFHTGDPSTVDINYRARPDSVELYDGRDAWQMTNLLDEKLGDRARVGFAAERLAAMLKSWVVCEGRQCP